MSPASAHEDDLWPYVLISCEKENKSISVAEGIAEAEAQILKIPNAIGLNQMLRFVPIGKDDGIVEIKSRLKKVCKIGGSTYRLEIKPYRYARRIQGMCGAAAPSVQLTVFRNRKILIQDLVFRINCPVNGDTENQIERVSFFEANQNAEFQLSKSKSHTRKILDFEKLPLLRRENLFR